MHQPSLKEQLERSLRSVARSVDDPSLYQDYSFIQYPSGQVGVYHLAAGKRNYVALVTPDTLNDGSQWFEHPNNKPMCQISTTPNGYYTGRAYQENVVHILHHFHESGGEWNGVLRVNPHHPDVHEEPEESKMLLELQCMAVVTQSEAHGFIKTVTLFRPTQETILTLDALDEFSRVDKLVIHESMQEDKLNTVVVNVPLTFLRGFYSHASKEAVTVLFLDDTQSK